jgi:hypothetical protein
MVAVCPVADDEAILTVMRSLPPSYRSFVSSLRRQPGYTLQSLITNLIQEETVMKDLSLSTYSENASALYMRKGILIIIIIIIILRNLIIIIIIII